MLCLTLVSTLACGNYLNGEAPQASGLSSGSAQPSGIDESEQIEAFEATLWPLLASQTCGTCHTSANGRTPFLLADANSTIAFRAIVDNNKVRFGNPSDSRLVARLAADHHHCWSVDCTADGMEMLLAVEAWIADIESRGGVSSGGEQVGAAGTLTSAVTDRNSGIEDTGGERYTNNLIAFWKFDEKTGDVARDTSGVLPAMDIVLRDGATLMESHGVQLAQTVIAASTSSSRKLYDHIAHPDLGTGQYSVEMWIVPADTTQEANMVRLSNDFRIRQRAYQYDYRNRSLAPGLGDTGQSRVLTYNVDRDLQAGLQHAVLTFDPLNGMKLFVNGVDTDDEDEFGGGPMWNWSTSSRFVLGGGGSDGWNGQIRMAAVYEQALTPPQIEQNYLAGVGLRLTLNFDISQWAGEGSHVEMSLSQLDDNSYLLCQPTIVTDVSGLKVSGMRVMVNEIESSVGQAFSRLKAVVNSGREQISNHCSMVENPPGDNDTFQLVFEGLAGWVDPVVEPDWPAITYDYTDAPVLPINGVRDFARVNETMASITRIPPDNRAVRATFEEVEQQLPGSFDLRSLVSSNQVGIAKLALEYCSEMVDSLSARDDFFGTAPSFEWNDVPSVAFDTSVEDKRLRIVDPLIANMLGTDIGNQPDVLVVEGQLLTLIDMLVIDCGACDAQATRDIVKGVCMSVLGSAATMVH
jgi:hypothetical protein